MPTSIRLVLLILTFALVKPARADVCLVQSTNLGGGLFSYTFQRGDALVVWGLSTFDGYIQLRSQGIRSVQDPPNWTHTIRPPDVIILTVTNGPQFLDQPVTFLVQSCLTQPTVYAAYTGGFISGGVYELPARTNEVAVGYQLFDSVGPTLPSLSVSRDATNVVIQWSGQAEGLLLQTSDHLAPTAAWTTVTNVPVLVHSMFTVTLPAADQQRFFRLACPCAP
jgi:hypothetical protein